jgi:hypothetical protein
MIDIGTPKPPVRVEPLHDPAAPPAPRPAPAPRPVPAPDRDPVPV